MPFIHVKSLPFEQTVTVSNLVEGLTKDFAKGTGIGLEHVIATWEFLSPNHYAVAGRSSLNQPEVSHPILVDLLSPDFNTSNQIEMMLKTIAESIAKRAKVPINNIFINHRQAQSGMVFDAGDVVRW